ncbi:hypothetical protein HK097_006273 [Rhizophlyctis rosea]|uniref:Endonuclease/exonuclease/phosphatase domain-containing protein n=1 Tax=Rhizophlyctis rosea TaxID=64517 RepID=A0AAD5SEA3_9FUNG|nr:hypothetical protein HK097_006273 [Rhizophlyctis rosea]
MEDTNTDFRIGISSIYPITIIQKQKHSFWHGALIVRLQLSSTRHLNILLTHLNPFHATARKKECEQIVATIQSSPHSNEEWLVMGDLNSLSRLDESSYNASNIVTTLTQTDKLSQKFLTEDHTAVDYAPLDTLMIDGELRDLSSSRNQLGHLDYSVPTLLDVDDMHATHMRLDYVFGNESIANKVSRCGVLRNEETGILSDHYPVILDFE